MRTVVSAATTAYVEGAESWTRENVGRGLTRDELGLEVGRYEGR